MPSEAVLLLPRALSLTAQDSNSQWPTLSLQLLRVLRSGEAQPRDAKSQEHLHLPDEQNSNDGPSIGEATYEQNRGTDWQPEDDRSQCNEAGLSQRLHPAQIATGVFWSSSRLMQSHKTRHRSVPKCTNILNCKVSSASSSHNYRLSSWNHQDRQGLGYLLTCIFQFDDIWKEPNCFLVSPNSFLVLATLHIIPQVCYKVHCCSCVFYHDCQPSAYNSLLGKMQAPWWGYRRSLLHAELLIVCAGQHRKTWECELCTFADNPFLHLRCLVCDHLRGTTWASMGMPACDAQQANAKRLSPFTCLKVMQESGALLTRTMHSLQWSSTIIVCHPAESINLHRRR